MGQKKIKELQWKREKNKNKQKKNTDNNNNKTTHPLDYIL